MRAPNAASGLVPGKSAPLPTATPAQAGLRHSTDLNRSVEAVKDAGGQVVTGPYEFPGGCRFHFTDPSGNELGVWAEA
jgi:uncharacterized protein